MMERLTKHKDGIVVFQKDGYDYAAVQMSSYDVYKVLQKLAWYEDRENENKKQRIAQKH